MAEAMLAFATTHVRLISTLHDRGIPEGEKSRFDRSGYEPPVAFVKVADRRSGTPRRATRRQPSVEPFRFPVTRASIDPVSTTVGAPARTDGAKPDDEARNIAHRQGARTHLQRGLRRAFLTAGKPCPAAIPAGHADRFPVTTVGLRGLEGISGPLLHSPVAGGLSRPLPW